MGAYKVPLAHACQWCGRRAIHEVFNARNASMGYYCGRCADERIRQLRVLAPDPLPR